MSEPPDKSPPETSSSHDPLDFRPAFGSDRLIRDEEIEALIGKTVAGNYQIIDCIGEGGMSVVYRAKHKHLQRAVAIKLLHRHLVSSKRNLERFKQEAQSVSQLDHVGVVRIHDFGILEGNRPFIVMDYLSGRSLSDVIKEQTSLGQQLDTDTAVSIFQKIAEALAYTHQCGIIHRDLKPSNIIVNLPKEVKILDFGIAKLMPHEGTDAVALTQTGEVFGSPLYMSPEQCKGEPLDNRSDIYSMGCLMYETLTGKTPINGANMLEILYRHMNEMPTPIKNHGVSIPKRLESVVFKCLAKDPRDRFQSMEELSQSLYSCQNEAGNLLERLLTNLSIYKSRRKRISKTEKAAAALLVFACSILAVSSLAAGTLYVMGSQALSQETLPSWKLSFQSQDMERPAQDLVEKLHKSRLIDTLKGKLEDIEKHKTSVADTGNNPLIQEGLGMARRLMRLGLSKDAADLAENCMKLSLAENGEYSYPTIEANVIYAQSLYSASDYTRAVACFEQILRTYRLTMSHQKQISTGMLCTLAGDCFYKAKNYQNAALALKDAREFYLRGDKSGEKMEGWESELYAFCFSISGDLAFGEKSYAEAIRYYEQAQKSWQSVTSPQVAYNRALILYKLAIAQVKNKQLDDAEKTYQKLTEYLKANRENTILAKTRQDFASGYAEALRENGAIFQSARHFIEIGLNRLKQG